MNLTKNPDFFQDLYQKEVIDKGWVDSNSTLAFIIQFYVYNPNYYMVNEKRVVVEFLETGGFINMEHDHLLINTKLYRTPAQNLQSITIMLLGFLLFFLSVLDIYLENLDIGGEDEDEEAPPAGDAAAAETQQAEAPAEGEEGKAEGEGEEAKVIEGDAPVSKGNLWTQVKNCDFMQKNNFMMNGMVFVGQGLKYVFDS